MDEQYCTELQTQIRLNLEKVHAHIQQAANCDGRRADEKKLLAVIKKQPFEIVQACN